MSLKDIAEAGVEVIQGLTVIPPNLNVLVDVEKRLGNLQALENITKIEDLRYLLYVLAKENRKYFDSDVDKPVITEQQIGKLINSWELEDIAKKLAQVMTSVVELKNSQRSTQETQK